MSLGLQSGLVLIATLLLYVTAPFIMFVRGWIIRAGLAMLVIQFLPVTWQAIAVPDSDAPGFGFLMLMTLPLSLLVIFAGAVNLAVRGIQRLRRERNA